MPRLHCIASILLLAPALLLAQSVAGRSEVKHSEIAAHVRGEMAFLASDALRGRGSATHDELVAAVYVVSQFQSFGFDDAQRQTVPLPDSRSTYNAIAILRGSDPALASQTVLLSAHLDHLGVRSTANGEVIDHGADDDASGTTAVLEFARALAALPQRPRRTVLFACFGSEETGGQGNQYFLEHPTVPLSSIVANLEFEMIGRPDPTIGSTQLWLTGWERSDLGPTLARRGAPLVGDPHKAENFFQRSDNYNLALQGIVAQTISSYGLGDHYHQPGDDLAHIDFAHLSQAIESMIAPIEWLANTNWKPRWLRGGRPQHSTPSHNGVIAIRP
jgi:Zn-dependent M28 family amino/carboxypeptidase